jgi:HAD superfamily hydrolase (TIGR01509 family)
MMRGVLLDVDGTLLDSNDAHARSWIEAFEGVGISLRFDQVRRLIGKGGDKLLWELADIEEDSVAGQVLCAHRLDIFRTRYAPELAPTPGARVLLEALRARDLALVVASSASGEELDLLLREAGVRDLLCSAMTASDVERNKPDPDVVRAAIARAGLPPSELVFVGDTPYDVEAGLRAGVQVVGLTCGGWARGDLRGAVAIYRDPADLYARLDESPICARTRRRSA